MKRFLLAGLVAATVGLAFLSSASAWEPPGVGSSCRRVGRLSGYWMQPTRGPLYDYSTYFATVYPYLPGAQEYQWSPNGMQGQFGHAVAVLPAGPPRPLPAARQPLPAAPAAGAPAVAAPAAGAPPR